MRTLAPLASMARAARVSLPGSADGHESTHHESGRRSSQIGADLLTQRERNWEVLSCHGAEAWRELDRGGLWDVVVWDLELGRWPHHRGAERPIIVAWCAPEATGALSDAMAQGADYPLVRHPGWESYFPES